MSSSPTRPVPSGFPTPSVDHLTAHFDSVNLGAPTQPAFAGRFKSSEENKPLPPTPVNGRTIYDPPIPASLQAAYGRFIGPPHIPQTTPAIPMPMPHVLPPAIDQSLTLTYARSAPPTAHNYAITPQFPQPHNRQPTSFHRHSSSTSTPTATSISVTTRIRASSTPPSPASDTASPSSNSTVQCSGVTKAGKRCNRVVKAPPPLSFFAPTSTEPIQRFCFQHVKDILASSGFYSHKEGAGWVKFADWIPDYLHPDTQAALRTEMEKPASKADEPGYIYAYEIRDGTAPDELKIKVGRAVKLVQRLDQWSKQCTSKEVILRGWWPGRVEDDDGSNGTSLLRGKIIAGGRGPFCHRLERLVHLELADLAVHAPYREPGFPKVVTKPKDTKTNGSDSTPSTPGRSPKPAKVRMPGGDPCKDCGAIHKEIFTFPRAPKGKYKDMEWERLVKPVIMRWGSFVGQCV